MSFALYGWHDQSKGSGMRGLVFGPGFVITINPKAG